MLLSRVTFSGYRHIFFCLFLLCNKNYIHEKRSKPRKYMLMVGREAYFFISGLNTLKAQYSSWTSGISWTAHERAMSCSFYSVYCSKTVLICVLFNICSIEFGFRALSGGGVYGSTDKWFEKHCIFVFILTCMTFWEYCCCYKWILNFHFSSSCQVSLHIWCLTNENTGISWETYLICFSLDGLFGCMSLFLQGDSLTGWRHRWW